MIDQATIDRILDAAQIMDVVSDFVTLRKRGVNYVGLCPFHSDKTPSFYVSPAKGLCKCFACGQGGNAEIQARELRRVANEYCEDTLKRTEEAVALSLDEVRKARQRFKSIAK